MPRPNSGAWRDSFRYFFSHNLHTLSHENSDLLLNRVRVLGTRGHLSEALTLFYAIVNKPNCQQVYATLFHECSRHGFVEAGLSLHRHVVAHNPTYSLDLFVSNHIVNMYCKFGHLDYAHQLFDEMPHRNLVSWTTIVSGYAQHGMNGNAFSMFAAMLGHCRPNEFAFSSVLSSCCCEVDGLFGRQVHALAVKVRVDCSIYVSNALISMYSKTSVRGETDDAWAMFMSAESRNTVSWNSMISVFQLHGQGARAVGLFARMRSVGISFDHATLLSVFSSLGMSEDDDISACFRVCVQLHCLSIKTGYPSDVKVATALIKAYSDLGGCIEESYRVFFETGHHRDIVTWTSIITTMAERNSGRALLLFSQLRQEGLNPDWYTFSIVLKACAGLVTETQASTVHSLVIKSGFEGDTVLSNSLVHAYARCGSISMSRRVFEELADRDLVSWNSILKAYALHGRAKEALHLYSQIDILPDPATFVALLSACSHAGLVEQGTKIFDSMKEKYNIVPQLDHYACMVDMFGRAGQFHEAERIVTQMPIEPDSVVWSALLGSCRKHGETRLAKLAANKVKELEPRSSLGYVQMSNMYCSKGKFEEAGLVWNEMREYRVNKEPGLSWVEIDSRVHEFASGGKRHPDQDALCNKLEELIAQLREIGYIPETNLALHDVEEEQKEEQLYRHSEKLALAFCIMNEEESRCRSRNVVKIVKNIRICVDCHKFMKLSSGLLRKEIVVRDSNRFHHFKDGICSCNDYW